MKGQQLVSPECVGTAAGESRACSDSSLSVMEPPVFKAEFMPSIFN